MPRSVDNLAVGSANVWHAARRPFTRRAPKIGALTRPPLPGCQHLHTSWTSCEMSVIDCPNERKRSLTQMQRLLVLSSVIILAVACGKSSGAGNAPDGGGSTLDSGNTAASCVANDTLTGSIVTVQQFNYDPKSCLPRSFSLQADGSLPCVNVSAVVRATCDCLEPGRKPVASAKLVSAVRNTLAQKADCDASTGPACSDYCVCEIPQATCASLESCRNDVTPAAGANGWCYVAPGQDAGITALTASCPDSQQQIMRFIGNAVPSAEELTFTACGNTSL